MFLIGKILSKETCFRDPLGSTLPLSATVECMYVKMLKVVTLGYYFVLSPIYSAFNLYK